MKKVHIAAYGYSVEWRNDLGCLDDKLVDEVVENALSPTTEEIENKLKAPLVK